MRVRKKQRLRFGRDQAQERRDFDDLLAGMTAANALERVERAFGNCARGRELFAQFRTVALCSYVREVEIDSGARRSPVDDFVLALSRELLIVCSYMKRGKEREWRASDPNLFRGKSHRLRSPERVGQLVEQKRMVYEASGIDTAGMAFENDPREYLPAKSGKAALGARVDRCTRALYDHFKLLEAGGVLKAWTPRDDAVDAVHGDNGVYSMYQLLGGSPPLEMIRRWRRALNETQAYPDWLPSPHEPLPPRDVLAREVGELLDADSS